MASPIRVRATAQADGELRLVGLPLEQGQRVAVVIMPEESEDDPLLSILEHDPAWAWLRDPAEDVYTIEDATIEDAH